MMIKFRIWRFAFEFILLKIKVTVVPKKRR